MGKVIKYDETRIRQIAGDLRNDLTQDDKLYIIALSQSLGLKFEGCSTCPNAYRDMALLIYTNMSKKKNAGQEVKPVKYTLKEGVDVYYMERRVNAATMNDELGEWLDKHGFPQRFWA